MTVVPDDWTPRMASAIAATLRECNARRLCGSPLAAFDVGCFPWHGLIELSLLTTDELDADSRLRAPGELANWRHYNFSVDMSSWTKAAELERQMADAYRTARTDCRAIAAEAFLRACATAVDHPLVQEAIEELPRDARFRVNVAQPDDGRQFWPPA